MKVVPVEATEPAAKQNVVNVYTPGSEADFARFYQNCYPRVVGTLVAMLGEVAAAEDCAQDAFERAYKKWASWRPDAPAEAWIHRIAINTAISYKRRMKLREVGEVVRRLGKPALPANPADVVERNDLLEALRNIPAMHSATIVLRFYHHYSNREIAHALGIPERTVASRLAAAKKKLKAIMEPQQGMVKPTEPSVA